MAFLTWERSAEGMADCSMIGYPQSSSDTHSGNNSAQVPFPRQAMGSTHR